MHTADVRGAGTDANVSLIIFGDKGDSGKLKLKKSETYNDKFERGQTDVFTFKMLSLGELIILSHKSREIFLIFDWFMESFSFETLESISKNSSPLSLHCTFNLLHFVNDVSFFLFPKGQLLKVRIWHDNKFLRSGWFLKQVDIEDVNESKTYEFQCNRWLAKDEDDGSILRELPCSNREPDGESSSRSHRGKCTNEIIYHKSSDQYHQH